MAKQNQTNKKSFFLKNFLYIDGYMNKYKILSKLFIFIIKLFLLVISIFIYEINI